MTEKLTAPAAFDFHCHIDLLPDPAAAIIACERERVMTLAVTTTPKAWPQNRRWTAASSYVHAAVGLHPELVGERHGEIGLLEEYIEQSRLVGEIGLDGSPQYRKSWQMQGQVFTRALKRAQQLGGRVLSIHSRRAADEVVQLLAEHTTADRVLPILHWYSGSVSAARKALDQGCYFSVNPRMLDSNMGLAVVRSLPTSRMLTETDAPFTASGDRPALPTDAATVLANLSSALGVEVGTLYDIVSTNAKHVLRFADTGNVAEL